MRQKRRYFMEMFLRLYAAIGFLINPDGSYFIKRNSDVVTFFGIGHRIVHKTRFGKYSMKPYGELTIKRRCKAAKLVFGGYMVKYSEIPNFGMEE
jgi:hypothetical protein